MLEGELDAFQRSGMPAAIDPTLGSQGIIRVDFTYVLDGESIPLYAIYPDMFPFVRPQVYAVGLDLPRHQNPFGSNLCLIGRSTQNWSTHDHLADLVVEQMPKLLAAARRPMGTPSPVAEEDQGEPVTGYLPEIVNCIVLVDSGWDLPDDVDGGDLVLVAESGWLGLKAYISRIAAGDREIGGLRFDRAWQRTTTIRARWARVSSLGDTFEPAAVARRMVDENPRLRTLDAQNLGSFSADIVGLVFPEELSPGRVGDGWLFVLRVPGGPRKGTYLARAGRAGIVDFAERIPELAPLHSKTVLQVGIGGIGAPVALELLRGGIGELRAVDHDILDPGTVVRWPLGLAYVGEHKVAALARFAAANWPGSTVVPHPVGIGRVRESADIRPEHELLSELIDGVDLIVDGTAELGIHRLLSELAWERDIPFVEAATRNGAWGGTIARVLPGAGRGCHVCLEYTMEERAADAQLAVAVKPGGLHQPTGCADPTFTGAGFDVASIALAGARLAVSTLCRGAADGYPDPEWDAAIVNLRASDGSLIPPAWSTFRLEPHDSCTRHH